MEFSGARYTLACYRDEKLHEYEVHIQIYVVLGVRCRLYYAVIPPSAVPSSSRRGGLLEVESSLTCTSLQPCLKTGARLASACSMPSLLNEYIGPRFIERECRLCAICRRGGRALQLMSTHRTGAECAFSPFYPSIYLCYVQQLSLVVSTKRI